MKAIGDNENMDLATALKCNHACMASCEKLEPVDLAKENWIFSFGR